MSFDDAKLRVQAVKALAAVPLGAPGGVKLRAIKNLLEATGLGLKECIPLIGWAIEQREQASTGDPLADALAEIASLRKQRDALASVARWVLIVGPSLAGVPGLVTLDDVLTRAREALGEEA